MFEKYYYISGSVLEAFPDLKHSNSIKGFYGISSYVALIPDFDVIDNYYNLKGGKEPFFAYPIVNSLVSLEYDDLDYDDDDNEIETKCELSLENIKKWGLLNSIEQDLGLTKLQNIAYVIYKLSVKEGVNPIDLINKI